MLKGIILDFDGTIVKSNKIKSDAFREIYNSFDNEIVEEIVKHHEDNIGMSRFKKIRYYNNLYKNNSNSIKSSKSMLELFSGIVLQKVINAEYVEGALEFIKNNYHKYQLFISTGTPKVEIKKILKGRKIIKYFTDIYGSPESKKSHIKQIFTKYNLNYKNLIFYGDSSIDHNIARYFNIPFVLISNNYNKNLRNKVKCRKIENFLGE